MKFGMKIFAAGVAALVLFGSVADVAVADSLIGQWEGRDNYTRSDGSSSHTDITLTIRRNAETGKLVGAIDSVARSNCSAKQTAKIYAHGNSVAVHGTVKSTTCKSWHPDSFELTLSSDGGLLTGTSGDTNGTKGKVTFYNAKARAKAAATKKAAAKKAAADKKIAAELESANIAYKVGNYEAAFPLYKSLAEGGSEYAQGKLAVMYEKGQGTAIDTAEAKKWYQRIIENEAGKPAVVAWAKERFYSLP